MFCAAFHFLPLLVYCNPVHHLASTFKPVPSRYFVYSTLLVYRTIVLLPCLCFRIRILSLPFSPRPLKKKKKKLSICVLNFNRLQSKSYKKVIDIKLVQLEQQKKVYKVVYIIPG